MALYLINQLIAQNARTFYGLTVERSRMIKHKRNICTCA